MSKFKNLISNHKYFIIAIGILILLTSYIVYASSGEEEIIKPVQVPLVKESELVTTIHVDIKGEVKSPGVYELKTGSMIIDIINLSGGLTDNADTSLTNLAYQLSDGMSFKIYSKTEVIDMNKEEASCICPTIEDTSCIISGINNTEDITKISINKGTLEQLDSLSGIGPSTAQKIIDYRNLNGNFITIEDIKNVSGIGDALFVKIKDFITI